MGWLRKRVAGWLGAAECKDVVPPAELLTSLDASWSGKGSQRYDPYNWGPDPSRKQLQARRTARQQHQAPPPPGRPSISQHLRAGGHVQLLAQPASPPALRCSGDPQLFSAGPDAASAETTEQHSSLPAQPPIHRSGSAPCTITMSHHKSHKELAWDSASSLLAGAAGCVSKTPAAPASEPATPLHVAGPALQLVSPPTSPEQFQRLATEQEEQEHLPRRASGRKPFACSTLSAALSDCMERTPQPAQSTSHGQPNTLPSPPESPSVAILTTLSRSQPASREPSVHGGTEAQQQQQQLTAKTSTADSTAAARQSTAQAQQQVQPRQQDKPAEGSTHSGTSSKRSGSGRPATAPLPCSREGSHHRGSGYQDLAGLPLGEPGEGQGDEGAGRAAGLPESALCSPGAVSLLSLQLRGPSAASSRGASREGSYRPLHRQLSAGGLSAALSRDASLRGGKLGSGRSREGSGRAGAMFAPGPGGPLGWPQLLPPTLQQDQLAAYSREASGRGGFQSREGSGRGGYMSRDGSTRAGTWALHPVAESGPYQDVPLPGALLGEGNSWTQRVTAFPTAPAAAACGAAERSGQARPSSGAAQGGRVGCLEQPGSQQRQQQQYVVDAGQLSAALSALAIVQPSASPDDQQPALASGQPPLLSDTTPTQPAQGASTLQEAQQKPARRPAGQPGEQHHSVPSSSAGGSMHGRKTVLVGDPDWATQDCPGEAWMGAAVAAAAANAGGEAALAPPALPAGKGVVHGDGGDAEDIEEVEDKGEERVGGEGGQECGKGEAAHEEHLRGEWNRSFIRRWKAVKKRAKLQGMGLRSLWKVNSPTDRHEPNELLVDLPENDLAWPLFWSPPRSRHLPAGRARAPPTNIPTPGTRPGGSGVRREPSLATMLLGEVAEVT
ncbi:hypothetical protein N2152v2_004887 [Parachlorella kessleri]